jgi:hypothetical protein
MDTVQKPSNSEDNGVRVVKFARLKSLVLFSKVQCSHIIITFINLLGHLLMKRCTIIAHILINRRRHSSVLDVRSFRAADCDTDHYMVVANLGREWNE